MEFKDNGGTRHLSINLVNASNSKHKDVGHYVLRELVFKGVLDPGSLM